MFGNLVTVVLNHYGPRVDWFPHDTVPDGTIVAPHHFVTGVVITAFAVYLAADDDKKPYTVAGLVVSGYAWTLLWAGPSPFLGALGTLAGLYVALWAIVGGRRWADLPWVADDGGTIRRWLTPRTLALIGVLIALDDAIEHAFGVWTPLDWVWGTYLLPAIRALLTLLA